MIVGALRIRRPLEGLCGASGERSPRNMPPRPALPFRRPRRPQSPTPGRRGEKLRCRAPTSATLASRRRRGRVELGRGPPEQSAGAFLRFQAIDVAPIIGRHSLSLEAIKMLSEMDDRCFPALQRFAGSKRHKAGGCDQRHETGAERRRIRRLRQIESGRGGKKEARAG